MDKEKDEIKKRKQRRLEERRAEANDRDSSVSMYNLHQP